MADESTRTNGPPDPGDLVRRHINESRMASELEQIDNMTDANLAHVVMLMERAIIPREVGAPLLGRLLEISEQGAGALGDLDPSEGLYLAYESRIIGDLGMRVGGAMHTGRSRNDLGATVHRMAARRLILQVTSAVLALREALLHGAADHLDTVMTGYTHHQPAQPITVAHWLLALEDALTRDTDRLRAAYRRSDALPLGACALAGTDFPVDGSRTAKLLGFSRVMENSLDAVAARDYATETLFSLAAAATNLSRLATDLQFWYTHEFGLIDFPDSLAGVSSIMPQKKNPVVLEWLRGRCSHVVSALHAALLAQKNTSYSNVIDVNLEGLRGFTPACRDTAAMLEIAAALIREITCDPERMRLAAAGNFSSVTLLANMLVRDHGLSFRAAYGAVSAVVREALARGMDSTGVGADMVADVTQRVTGHRPELSEEGVRRILDPVENVNRLQYGGGPSPRLNGEQLELRTERLDADHTERASTRRHLDDSRRSLLETAAGLTGK